MAGRGTRPLSAGNGSLLQPARRQPVCADNGGGWIASLARSRELAAVARSRAREMDAQNSGDREGAGGAHRRCVHRDRRVGVCASGGARMKLDAKIPSGPIASKWDRHKFEMKLVNPANKRKYTIIVVGTGLAGASA